MERNGGEGGAGRRFSDDKACEARESIERIAESIAVGERKRGRAGSVLFPRACSGSDDRSTGAP